MTDRKSYKLELITQEKQLIDDYVNSAVIPTGMGPIGVLPGHAPLIGTLDTGVLRASGDPEKKFNAFVDKGFFMVYSGGLTIIAQSAEMKEQIDLERAIAAKKRAEQIIDSEDRSLDLKRAKDALLRARARIKVAGNEGP